MPPPSKGLSKSIKDTIVVDAREIHLVRADQSSAQKLPSGLLIRELARQALLLAAREQLGLSTRDETLREAISLADDPGSYPVTLLTEIDPDRKMKLEISSFSKDGRRVRLETAPFALPEKDWLVAIVEHFEPLTRSQFIGFFKDLGYAGQASRAVADAEVTEPVAHLLEEMDFISQFAAIRELHAAIRRDGESPQRLGALARGYANLGTLTEFHWTPAHKAFKARALLYAERLVAREHRSAFALWNRAYVRALVGLHRAALDDLELAINDGNRTPAKAPPWVEAVRAFCAYEPDRLALVETQPGNSQLVQYLVLLTHEWSIDDQVLLKTTSAMIEANGDCDRAVDKMSSIPPLGIRRLTSSQSLRWFAQRLYPRLAAVPNLPASVKTLVERRPATVTATDEGAAAEREEPGVEIAARMELLRTLHEAGDAQKRAPEPSWQVLEQLIRDVSFVLVWRAVDFEANMLGVAPDKTRKVLAPLVEGYPYELFVQSFVSDPQLKLQHMRNLQKALNIGQHELTEWAIDQRLGKVLGATVSLATYSTSAIRNQDHIFRDLVRTAQMSGNSVQGRLAPQVLLEISPRHPATIISLAGGSWTYAGAHAAEWEQRYRDTPDVQQALGKLYINLERPDDAKRVLARAATALPSCAAYRRLASVQLQQTDFEGWQESLEHALEYPVMGLDHTQIRVDLANHFMRGLEWERALPYALAAAQSYALFALECAGRCYEGMEDWENSEAYVRAAANRYGGAAMSWFLWCARTGRGDKLAAQQLANDYLSPRLDSPAGNGIARMQTAILHALSGDADQALAGFLTHWKKYYDFPSGYYAISLADELGKHKERDELLQYLATGGEAVDFNNGRWRYRLALLFVSVLERKGTAAWNSRRFEDLLVECDDEDVTDVYYFAGRFLAMRGDQEFSQKYLKMSASSPVRHRWTCALANFALRNEGIAAGPTRGFELEENRRQLATAVRLGNFERSRGLHDRAIKAYTKALELEPGSRPALLGRAKSELNAEKFAEALADCDALLTDSPDEKVVQKLRQDVIAAKPGLKGKQGR